MDHLLTEARNNASTHLDALSAIEIVRLMNAEDAKIAAAVATQADAIAQAIDIIAERFRRGGRLLYIGAGTSGRLGVLDASECPPTFNSPPSQVVGIIAGGPTALTTAVEGAEDSPQTAVVDLQVKQLSPNDVLVGIATSGRTPYVIGALQYAKQVKAYAIGFACVPDSELVAHADLMIAPLVGPEVLTGSTRLKAGTATKLVLNMLTTGAMVRTGKAYGNLMVDLRATNTKLKARTNRIVRHLLNVDEQQAAALLTACNGELKTAIVAGKTNLAPDEARKRLADVGGLIHVAIKETPTAPPEYPGYVIGIDGGGTNTTAVLAAGETIIGRGKAGPSNIKAVGQASACEAIKQAIVDAFTDAKLLVGRVGSIAMGLAGAGRREDQIALQEWAVSQRLAHKAKALGDVELPLELLPERWGISVVAGTGSCVFGRTKDGRTARAGGWGPLLGDGGSAYELVLAALRAVTRDADGIQPAVGLRAKILRAMSLNTPQQMVAALHDGEWDRRRIASLAPALFEAAEYDPVAKSIVDEGAETLVAYVISVLNQLDLDPYPLPIALTGGLLLNVERYRTMIVDKFMYHDIDPNTLTLVPNAAEAAAKIALAELRPPT